MAHVTRGLLLFRLHHSLPLLSISRSLKLIESGEVNFAQPPSFDYTSTGFSLTKSLFDNTVERFNDNTKVIVVEGNIACGKSHLASKLAKYFGMVHFPDPTEDNIYLCKNHTPPFDLRVHNPLLPDYAKYYTGEMFWNEEDLINKGKPLFLQYQYYIQRYWNYLKALCHLFNTGRGVIMDRSPFSDVAFAEAMYKCGYLSELGYRWFKQNHGNTAKHLWKPHLIIYVRPTNQQIREQLKKRNIPWEMNGRNMNDKFFDALRDSLEKYYLNRMNRYSQILTIDGSTTDVFDDDDICVIAQKVTEIDLVGQFLLRDDYKLLEWRAGLHNDRAKINARALFSNADEKFSQVFNQVVYPTDLHELCYSYDAHELQAAVMKLDSRTRVPPSYNTRYKSLSQILFNPWLVKKNFSLDLPKDHLWL